MQRAVLLCVCLAATLVGASATARATSADSAQTRAELNTLRDRIDAVRHRIASDSSRRSSLSDALAKAQDQISAARKRLDGLDDAIAEHHRRIDRLTAARDSEREHLSTQLDRLRAQVRSAYETGRVSRMRLLLSGQPPAEVGRMLGYYRYFADAQSGQVTSLRQAVAKLAEEQRALEEEQSALADRRDAREQTLDHLQANRSQQKATIAALDRQLSEHRSSLADMQADEHQLEQLLGSVQNQLSSLPPLPPGSPFAQLKGRMRPPVQGPVLARFGQPKSGGPLSWQGEWLGAREGTPIDAVASGRVVYVGYMKRYGLIVIIDHGNGYYTLYGHASASYVDVGDRVNGGQPIATAGRSGGHDQSGAYFEIRHGQTAINPARWLSG